MKQKRRFSFKTLAMALTFSSLLLSGAAQAHYDDDDFDDAWLALVPVILYSALSEPRVVVHKRYYREGRLVPRYSRERHHHKKHRRSRSRDHYQYPQRGRHHGRH